MKTFLTFGLSAITLITLIGLWFYNTPISTAPEPNTELVCAGNTMERCITVEELKHLHDKCEKEFFGSEDWVWKCDLLFADYNCKLYNCF